MKKKQNKISNPKFGMARARAPYVLEDSYYTFMLNGQSVDESGNRLTLSNEHSTILASKLKSGFVVIGAKNHVVKNRTYFFITNPTTKVSEIGYIDNKRTFTELSDTDSTNNCDDCIPALNLAKPLEEFSELEVLGTAHQTYVTIVEDSCNLCLNFNVDYPIFDIEIKIENVGEPMFFTDNLNDVRYIKLDDLAPYGFEGEEVCGEGSETPTCLDCDKLRVFSLYNNPKVEKCARSFGGSLRKGVYEVFFAYSDELGNERTSYVPLTVPISIFDSSDLIFEQEENNSVTNFSIQVELGGLDSRFTHYKVVVAENASQTTDQGSIIYRDKGVSSIADTIILVSDNLGGTVTPNKILIPKPAIDTWKGLTASNNYLFGYGVKEKEDVNLQPIFNLMGSLVQWETAVAKGDLYSKAVSNKFKSYNRDEVYPLGIRPISNDGYQYPISNLIPRPSDAVDIQVVDNLDTDSILDIVDNCDELTRNKRWQFYNTATEVGTCSGFSVPTLPQQETITTITSIAIPSIPADTIDIPEEDIGGYTDLTTYINDNADTCGTSPYTGSPLIDLCPYLDLTTLVTYNQMPLLSSECEAPEMTLAGTSGTANVIINGNNYLATFNTSLTITASDFVTTHGATILSTEGIVVVSLSGVLIFTTNSAAPSLGISNVSGDLTGTITNPTLTNEAVQVASVVNESAVLVDKLVANYILVVPTVYCSIFLTETDDNVDENFSSSFFLRAGAATPMLNKTVRTRTYITIADSSTTALEVQNVNSSNFGTFSPTPYAHPWYGLEQDGGVTEADPDVAFASMVTTKDSFVAGSTLTVANIGGGIPLGTNVITYPPTIAGTGATVGGATVSAYFTDKVNKGALWFKIPINDRDKFYVEFVRLTETNNSVLRYDYGTTAVLEYFKNKYIRYNIYPTTAATTAVKGAVIQLTSSSLVALEAADTAGSTDGFMYMSVELPIAQGKGVGQAFPWDDTPTPAFVHCGVTVPLGSCFSVHTRDEEFSKITVSFDSISLVKKQTYETSCVFNVPIPTDCDPIPFKYGKFGYWESTEKYPDNTELYDSSMIDINQSDIPAEFQSDFEDYYVDSVGGGGEYTLNTGKTQFLCNPIRHYKFPDNKVAPFIHSSVVGRDADVVIQPLGIKMDDDLFNSFLDIAVNNNLITQSRRDKIVGYEIYRGDRQLSKSILSSGLLFDMRTYTDNSGRDVRYPNFPYNSLGVDKVHKDLDDTSLNLGNTNHLFSFHSPESDYYKSDKPTEISVQGYQFGRSVNTVAEVEDHPKWVILGKKARTLATLLATVEGAAELAVNVAQSAEVYRVGLPLAPSLNLFGVGLNVAVILAEGAALVLSKIGRYRYEWLKTFRDLGTQQNFAYFNTSTAKYNYIKVFQQEGNMLRGVANAANLKSGFFTLTENVTGEPITINNIDREDSLFLSFTSAFGLDHSPSTYSEYINHDNNDASYTSSQVLASEFSCVSETSDETYRNVASPYVAIKTYNPNQYGTIDSVRWVFTGYTSKLEDENCGLVLGGDIFIAPHSIKRKLPVFKQTSFGQANLTPFAYSLQKNVGKPKFFIDYEIDGETSDGTSRVFPNIEYNVEADCYTGENDFYVKPPTKFYLYYYGNPLFYTETTINTNYRNARKEPWNQFYPQNRDYVNLTQEKTVSIRRPNTFFYNYGYSYQGSSIQTKVLPPFYSKALYAKQSNNPNSVMYSQQDNSENSISEPWLNYKPNDAYVFPAAYGRLKRLKGIESQQVLGTFENQSVVFNAVDAYVDGITANTADLGTGGIFAKRPRTFSDTDLGYIGSQSSAVLSCEFGHFIVDAYRGQVFNIQSGGQKVEEISKYSGGKLNGMDVWFKEHLPFKILEDYPAFSDYIDNPYNGVGITIGWDSKFKRILITKKDYTGTEGTTYNGGGVFNNGGLYTIQQAIKAGILKDASWTVAYKPEKGGWESYMDYKPNYYVNHTDYFQSGINQSEDSNEFGLWSHLLTNRSKQVFYGKKYPWTIEYPTKNEYVTKTLEGITLWTEAKRYHAEYDFAPDDRITFNKAVIYSDRENSGNLNLIPNTGVLSQLSTYPITKVNEQDILITQNRKKWTFNHIFNRVKSNRNNVPLFTYDINQINKVVNPSAVSFYGKNVLEQMSAENFIVRLTQDKTSQYDIELKFASQKEEIN